MSVISCVLNIIGVVMLTPRRSGAFSAQIVLHDEVFGQPSTDDWVFDCIIGTDMDGIRVWMMKVFRYPIEAALVYYYLRLGMKNFKIIC
jgi:hypothetical protein